MEQITLELRELGPDHDSEWDGLASECLEAGLMQSSAWAAFKRAEGYDTFRYGLYNSEALIGGASFLLYDSGREPGLIFCPEGPVLPWQSLDIARKGLKLLIAEARRIGEARGSLGLRIEPHLAPPRPSLLRSWQRSPVDLTPVHTLMLDLTLSEEELLAGMHPKGRYNYRLSQRHGVTVRRSQELSDVALFHRLFEETARRNDFYEEPYGYFLNLCGALFPAGMAELYFAEWEGQTLATILTVRYGQRCTFLYGGSTGAGRRVMASYPLHIEAMRDARSQGCREYDLFGYDPFGIPDHQYAGISRFKNQWGGRRVDWIGAWDCLFYETLADRLAESLREKALG